MERIIEESVEIQQNEETNNNIDNVVLENSDLNNDGSFLVDIDHDEAMALTNESLLGSQVTCDGLLLPSFGATETDQYINIQLESECLRSAYGCHWRSGMVSTANLCRNENANAVTAMGIEYCEFDLMPNKDEHEEDSVTKLEERILAHCLLLPYVIPSKKFEAKFWVVYADWEVGTLNNPKQQISPCATTLMS